jgi:hypothetical protein
MSGAEIKAIVDKLDDITRELQDADPDDKTEIFRKLGLSLTNHLGRRLVEAQIEGRHSGPIAPEDLSYRN